MIRGFLVSTCLMDIARPQRVLGWGLLMVLLFGVGRLYLYVSPEEPVADAYNQLSSLLVYRVLMLGAAIFSASVIAQEVEQKTIVYLATRPIPRPDLILSRMAAAMIAVATLSLAAALSVSFSVYGREGLSNPYLLRDAKGLVVGSMAYVSLFTLTSLWMNRSMLVNLIFAFGWETIVANLSGNTYRLSIFTYLKAIAEKPTSSSGGPLSLLSGDRGVEFVSVSTAWGTMAVLTVACCWACAWWFQRFAYLPREDAE